MVNKLLIIGLVWPEPNATAAGGRMMQLIHFFISEGYQITFASTAQEPDTAFPLHNLGVKKAAIQLNHSSFDDFILKLNPSIVLFDRFITEEQFGWRISEQLPNTLKILDTEDLHSLRAAREKAFKKNEEFTLEHWQVHDTTKREIASIYRCDLSFIISSYEMEILENHLKVPSEILLYLPFQLDSIKNSSIEKWIPFEEREGFICIGNGKHAPNVDAFLWLKKEIWPLIRKQLPKIELSIYGAYLPQQVKELHNPKEGFNVLGRAEIVENVMSKAKLNLAPLRFGAGIKGKLTDAMRLGTPSITTTIGAEGMHQKLPWCGVIENESIAFANAAVSLYQNKIAWEHCQENGIEIINSIYDRNKLNNILKERVGHLVSTLPNHRKQNFIGSLLQHHSMMSSKYLSKWIEEKNKE